MGQNVSCLVTIFIITPIGGPGHGAAVTLDNKEAIETQIIDGSNTVTPPERGAGLCTKVHFFALKKLLQKMKEGTLICT